MQLGEVIRQFSDEANAAEALLACGDLALIAQVHSAASGYDETVGDYTAGAVRRFAFAAGDEDWLKLMTALERAADPGMAALATMVRWSVDMDRRHGEGKESQGCSCGSGHGDCG